MARKPAPGIIRPYIRRYSDIGQTAAYVEWSDGSSTEGTPPGKPCRRCGSTERAGSFMAAPFARAEREGITVEHQEW